MLLRRRFPSLLSATVNILDLSSYRYPIVHFDSLKIVTLAITKFSIMVFNTITVTSAVTPTVIETYFSHVRTEPPPKTDHVLTMNAVPE